MKKQFTTLMTILGISASLVGCGSSKNEPTLVPETTIETENQGTEGPAEEEVSETTSLTSSEVYNKITDGIEFPVQNELDATLLSDIYNIDASLLEDFCVKMPMMSAHLAEVGVFKVKDANNVNSIVAAINQRASDVGISLYPSLEETYESRVIVTKGIYILFAMDENASKIEENFNNLIK